MKAVVLAGGYATRLWPITKNRAKPLLPLGDREIIDYILSPMTSEDRIDEIYISTNERFREDFEEYLDTRGYSGIEIVAESTRNEEEKLGTVGALSELIDRKEIDEDTLVIAGDNLYSFDISDYLDYYESNDGNLIAAYDVGSREKAKQYGLVDLDDDLVVDFQEKPDDPKSTLVSIACYIFRGENLGDIREYIEGGNNPDAPGFFIEWLQKREEVRAYSFDGNWFDVGTPESYIEANKYILNGEAFLSDGVEVKSSDIGENTYIMESSEVVDTDISNSIVFPGTKIEESEIQDSIIDSDVEIKNLDLTDSIVGSNTMIRGD